MHFTVLNHVVPVEYYVVHEIERQAGVGFQGNQFIFAVYVKELPIIMYTACELLKTLNEWVERMAVRGGFSPLSGLICKITNSVGEGNFAFVRKTSRKFRNLWLWQP